MNFLTVKNWKDFQHYGKRNPPWIKLHRAVIDDYTFCSLPDVAKSHLMLLWLYASQNNGRVPIDLPFLENKLSIKNLDLAILSEHGFLIPEGDAGKGPGSASRPMSSRWSLTTACREPPAQRRSARPRCRKPARPAAT